ncbi:PLD nuclease N-terminal domain-containing protein [Agromyces ramosus]|uniref:Cardiolipin synthase N-terminal domain-containing protein n=1 Tax=Agromyces ramosus TaxID=33879 RepID=A0ABU0R937_9MICO|nr:PLD nuclease N-terminal domain-containing protein [Agromyces ramosus]MDQ0894583.1 hypothetical protein [Agromyces ramosus]
MIRLAIPVVVAAVVFTIYAVVDCALFDRMRIRGLPRGWWIVVILLVPLIGATLWFVIGRGRANRSSGRGYSVAPDDDADFLRQLNSDAAQDERIRRLEQELAELDGEPEATDPGDARDGDGRGADGRGAPDDAPDGPRTERTQHPDTPETPGEAGPSGRPNG